MTATTELANGEVMKLHNCPECGVGYHTPFSITKCPACQRRAQGDVMVEYKCKQCMDTGRVYRVEYTGRDLPLAEPCRSCESVDTWNRRERQRRIDPTLLTVNVKSISLKEATESISCGSAPGAKANGWTIDGWIIDPREVAVAVEQAASFRAIEASQPEPTIEQHAADAWRIAMAARSNALQARRLHGIAREEAIAALRPLTGEQRERVLNDAGVPEDERPKL